MPDPRGIHRASTRLLSLAMIAIGVLLVVRTLTAGGGALALGVVLGVLFVAAGAARQWLQTRTGGKGER
jgi:multisubunit Na+/H+ antiporter MnhB subunit